MIQDFVAAFSERAHRTGLGRLEFYIKENSGQAVQVYEGEVERLELASETLIYVEGEYQGYRGSTFIENAATARIEEHLEILKQIAAYNQEPFQPRRLPQQEVPGCGLDTVHHDINAVAEWLKEAEREALVSDPRLAKVSAILHSSRTTKTTLLNDWGEQVVDTLRWEEGRISVLAQEEGSVQSAFESRLGQVIGPDELLALAQEAAGKAVAQLQATPASTGIYSALLKNSLVCELILAFLPGLFAARVQKKMSNLGDKLGSQIASPLFSLREEPGLPDGIVTRSFDDEGTPTRAKNIIDRGILTTFLHNLETARTAGVEPTGNGFKRLYREPPATGFTNLCILGGAATWEELIATMHTGVIITDCDGIFAGADPVSGDFSLIAKGFLVERGTIQRPVNQITIAGNFYDILQGIEVIGGDYWAEGSGSGFIKAPSLLVNRLFVTGR